MKSTKILLLSFLILTALCLCTLAGAETESNHIHREAAAYTPIDDRTHEVSKYCTDPDCGMELSRYEEEHSFADGTCSKCGHACPHSSTHTESIPVEGENDYKWDGAYLTYTVLKITCCEKCGTELSRNVGEERLLHETHTNPVHISYSNENKNSHTEKLACSLCGTVYSVSRSHQWVQAGCYETDSKDTHTVIMHCSQCGAVEERTQNHSLREARRETVDNSFCVQVLQCSECGKEIRMEPVQHSFSLERYVSGTLFGGERFHNRVLKCDLCSFSYVEQNEPHQWKYGVCTLCGEKKVPDHEHRNNDYENAVFTSCSATEHFRCLLCSVCGQPSERPTPEPHRFDPATGICRDCGYARDGHAHEVDLVYDENLSDDEHHVFTGVCSICGRTVIENGEHTVSNKTYTNSDDNTCIETGICTRCGHASVKRLHHSSDYSFIPREETHYYYCKNCKGRFCEAPHTYVEQDGKLRCAACGYEREAPAPHEHQLVFSYAFADDQKRMCRWVYTCSECGLDYCELKNHEPLGDAGYDAADDERHIATFFCRYCQKMVKVSEKHIFENDKCVYCGMYVHIHSFEEYSSAVDPHLYYYQCRCGKIDREEIRPCELQSRYRVLSETQHEFRYECVICGAVKGKSTVNHIFVNGICETCGYVQGTDVPVENDALTGEGKDYSNAAVTVLSGNSEFTLRGSLLLPWHVLAIDRKAVECLPEVYLPEGAQRPVCVFRPENVPEDGFYEMLLTRQQMRDLVLSGIGSLRVEINGYEIVILTDVTDVLRRMDEQQTEEIVIIFCLDPDAPEGARDTSAYLFVSVPFDLYEMENVAEPEQTAGL